ncbi:MAG: histidine phosphatase family protein [Lachnospiraceae bacterium]|nr:histidine phosphatase family protein [Lachnospiraceae bacterium]
MTDFEPAHRESNTESNTENNTKSNLESKTENGKNNCLEKKTTIYLVRHGTTEWNQQLRYQGRADNPLDDAGERQGSLLENYFADIDVDLGVTSPLQRAKKTLEYCLASQKHPVPVIVDPSVIEFDFGVVDGMTKEQLQQLYPEFFRMYVLNEDRGHAAAPGGESLRQVYCRMRDGILRIAREHQGSTIVIASHGTAIQTFLNFASGIPWQEMKHFLLYNVSVSCVEIEEDGTPRVVFIGDRRHIPEELAFCYARPR